MPDRPAWMDSPVANVDFGKRDEKYYAQLLESQRTGECIFCAPGFPHDQTLFWEDQGWMLFECRPPRKDIKGEPLDGHMVLAPRAHGEAMLAADWLAIGAAYRFIEEELDWLGFGICWRIGDPSYSGRTIIHRHLHVLKPRREFNAEVGILRAVSVLFPIG